MHPAGFIAGRAPAAAGAMRPVGFIAGRGPTAVGAMRPARVVQFWQLQPKQLFQLQQPEQLEQLEQLEQPEQPLPVPPSAAVARRSRESAMSCSTDKVSWQHSLSVKPGPRKMDMGTSTKRLKVQNSWVWMPEEVLELVEQLRHPQQEERLHRRLQLQRIRSHHRIQISAACRAALTPFYGAGPLGDSAAGPLFLLFAQFELPCGRFCLLHKDKALNLCEKYSLYRIEK